MTAVGLAGCCHLQSPLFGLRPPLRAQLTLQYLVGLQIVETRVADMQLEDASEVLAADGALYLSCGGPEVLQVRSISFHQIRCTVSRWPVCFPWPERDLPHAICLQSATRATCDGPQLTVRMRT